MTSNACVIHCRVSTGKQAYEGESLAVQERICRNIAERDGWKLAHEPWLEAYSGRKNARPVFASILDFIDENPGLVGYYIFRSIDRFTRRGTHTYETMKRELTARGVAMVDSTGVIQPLKNSLEDVGFEYDWSVSSPSEITEVVLATTAKAEITTILTRLIGQEIRLTRQGYKIRAPQDGFFNEKVYVEGKRRTIQVPDPQRAPYINSMFELRAGGQLTDQQIVERLNASGFRTREQRRWDAAHQRVIGSRGGVPLTVKKLKEAIKRPIYCGIVWEKWTNWQPIRAAYPGLVSIDTYNAANRGVRYIDETGDELRLLHNYRKTALLKRDNPLFPYKNVVLCPTCSRPFMASSSRSRNGSYVPAYHCARRHVRVAYGKGQFEKIVSESIRALKFHPAVIDVAVAAVWEKYRERQADLRLVAASVASRVDELEAEKATIIRAFAHAQTSVMRRALEHDVERLEAEIVQAQTTRSSGDATEAEIGEYAEKIKEVMSQPSILLEADAAPTRRRSRFETVFERLPTIDELFSGTAKYSPIIDISKGQDDPEYVCVRLRALSWNQIYSKSVYKNGMRFNGQ